MSVQEHQSRAGEQSVGVAIATVSDTRTRETDENRKYLEARLHELGHKVVAYRLVPDEPVEIATTLTDLCAEPEVQMVLFNGGTGIAPRDTTYDVISRHLNKTMPGFGELFRALSYEEIGSAAMISRSVAGVYHDTLVFSMPGSNAAVKLAMEKLIIPEMNHLVWELARTD